MNYVPVTDAYGSTVMLEESSLVVEKLNTPIDGNGFTAYSKDYDESDIQMQIPWKEKTFFSSDMYGWNFCMKKVDFDIDKYLAHDISNTSGEDSKNAEETIHHTAVSDGDLIPDHSEIVDTEQTDYSSRPVLHVWYTTKE